MFTEFISGQIKWKGTGGALIIKIRNKALYKFIENVKERGYFREIDIDYKII
jgi:hypothetical protein